MAPAIVRPGVHLSRQHSFLLHPEMSISIGGGRRSRVMRAEIGGYASGARKT